MNSQDTATFNHHAAFHPEFQHWLIWGVGVILHIESTVTFYHF